MKFFCSKQSSAGLACLALLLTAAAPMANAHLMVAQHGTINIVGNGAFLVLSIPTSTFENIDDNADGMLSDAEFSKYRKNITAIIHEKLELKEAGHTIPLQGLLLSPVHTHDNPNTPADQLVLMGKFVFSTPRTSFTLDINLFGEEAAEKELTVSIKTSSSPKRQTLVFTPELSCHRIFDPASEQC